MFTLGSYGRVVAVLSSGETKELACLYSAHNLPILNIGSSPLPSFGWDYCDIFDIQTYLSDFTAVLSSHNGNYLQYSGSLESQEY